LHVLGSAAISAWNCRFSEDQGIVRCLWAMPWPVLWACRCRKFNRRAPLYKYGRSVKWWPVIRSH